MLPVFQAAICKAGAHCKTCRDHEAETWRRSTEAAFRLEPKSLDKPCPFGKPWNNGPPDAIRLGDIVKAFFWRLGIHQWWTRRNPQCGCAARQKKLNRFWLPLPVWRKS